MNKHKPKYTDKEIIECLKTGNNSKALEFLYLDIFPKVKSYVISNSGNEDDALDIFQDAIVTLCNQIKLKKFNPEYQVAGFVYSVCRNMWINRAKRNKKMVYTSEEIDVREDEDFTEH
ncbi:MAG: hypothetical protein MI922_11635, partial [Bacteroidales bacterium]|nr:hypothetical protein [Bacteroidales bacterium]